MKTYTDAEIAELVRDRERLDWLERAPDMLLEWDNQAGPKCYTQADLSRFVSIGRVSIDWDSGEIRHSDGATPSLRAAIDAAMTPATREDEG